MKQQYLLTKKGQVYTLDFMIALLLFVLTILVSSKMIFNTTSSNGYQILQLEAKAISESLLSEGLPSDWDSTDVILPGIIDNGKLSDYKFKELIKLGYANVSSLINSRRPFYFYFANSSSMINVSITCGFGAINSTCQPPSINSNNLVRLDRLVAYNEKAIRMVVLVWE